MIDIKKLLSIRIPRASIDIDITSRYDLVDFLCAMLKIHKFNIKPYYVRISPSKKGIHIIIDRDFNAIENIIIRGFLYDDPYRLRYSLMRIAAKSLKGLKIHEGDIDLLFISKKHGIAKPFKDAVLLDTKPIEEKVQRWLNMDKMQAFQEMYEYVDELLNYFDVTLYIVYGKIHESEVDKIVNLKRLFVKLPYKLCYIQDPYNEGYILAKVDCPTEEDAKKVVEILKQNGIKEVWYMKRKL